MPIKDQHILITGGEARIGRHIALHLARLGAHLTLHYHSNEKQAKATQTEIHAFGVDCQILQADLADYTSSPKLLEAAQEARALDALINNASMFGPEDFSATLPESWQKHLDVNLSAPFFLSQALIKAGKQANRAVQVINILDWRALRPGADHFAYTISKAALASLTQALAVAAAPHARVNGIALGAILPPSDGGNVDHILEKVPLKRWGDPDQVAATVEFLLSGPDYITGDIIHLDGGRHLV
mgnify:CR=1 FL=1